MSTPVFRKTIITRLLEASSHPAYALDDKRRVIYANEALAAWLGVDRETLAGVTCDYVAESNSIAAGLCPPPSVFHGFAMEALVHSPQTSNEPLACQFLPLVEGDEILGVLAVAIRKQPTGGQPSVVDDRLHDVLMQSRKRDASAAGVFPLVGVSPLIRRSRRQFNIAIQSAASVLISAHSSEVAERVARSVHARRNPNADVGLVPLACPLLDAELIQTTLTAFIQRCAELETEKPPTLLLLDVDQLSEEAQRELTGFLAIEELALQTLATSSASLPELIERSDIRTDLAAALSTIEIALPRLKDRPGDVPLVIQAALETHNTQSKKQYEGFEDAALEQMIAYPWPGDLPEVLEVVKKSVRAASDSPGVQIVASDLPREIRLGLDAIATPESKLKSVNLDELLFEIERDLVARTLDESRQNRAEAARRLGISRNKLLRRIAHLGLGKKAATATDSEDSKQPGKGKASKRVGQVSEAVQGDDSTNVVDEPIDFTDVEPNS